MRDLVDSRLTTNPFPARGPRREQVTTPTHNHDSTARILLASLKFCPMRADPYEYGSGSSFVGEAERHIGIQNGGWRLAQTFPSFQTIPLVAACSFHLVEANFPSDRGNRICVTSLELGTAAARADFVSADRQFSCYHRPEP